MYRSAIASSPGVTRDELAQQAVELLPQRAALSGLVNIATIVPVNIAIAVNAATIGSSAAAQAIQRAGVIR